MKRGAWWVNVLVIFAAGFLESMQRALGVVPGINFIKVVKYLEGNKSK